MESHGSGKGKPIFHAFEAEALLHAKHIEEALASVNQGLVLSQETKDAYYDAELWRLKSEILLHIESQTRQAEAGFLRAIHTARPQGAKSLELRAVTALARCLRLKQQQPK